MPDELVNLNSSTLSQIARDVWRMQKTISNMDSGSSKDNLRVQAERILDTLSTEDIEVFEINSGIYDSGLRYETIAVETFAYEPGLIIGTVIPGVKYKNEFISQPTIEVSKQPESVPHEPPNNLDASKIPFLDYSLYWSELSPKWK